MTPRFPRRTIASPGLHPCSASLPSTANWRSWDIPWPSPHVASARFTLPPDYTLAKHHLADNADLAEAEIIRQSTDRALGIWFAHRPTPRGGVLPDIRSWAFHLSPEERYPNSGFTPPPTLLHEHECVLTSAGGRIWNVITFVTESRELGTLYRLAAYSKVTEDLCLSAGGGGAAPDAEAEALAILTSFQQIPSA